MSARILAAERLERIAEHLGVADTGVGVLVEKDCVARIEALMGIGRDVDALHHLVGHDAERPGVARFGDPDRGRSGVQERHLRVLHERHDGKRRVRAFLAENDGGLVLIEQPFGGLRGRQRTAGGIFILNLQFVAVHAGLVELLDCEVDALLILRAEISARARRREQTSDLDDLVLGESRVYPAGEDHRGNGRGSPVQHARAFRHGFPPCQPSLHCII